MSARAKIRDAIVELLRDNLDGTTYSTNLYSKNISKRLKFWDEVNDYPYVAVVPGPEEREYLPASFKWGFLTISIKIYIRDETDTISAMETVLADIEKLVDLNYRLLFDAQAQDFTEDIRVSSITTDEGLLHPIGVAELDLIVQYQVK